ncbi:MAG: GntR family transcriptional regulator [Methylocystaceae bacterium]
MISIDYKSRLPIYEQLVENIRKLVLNEIVGTDSQLPSVRQLSADLGINPNTVQKAYTTLEQQGVLYSIPGKGSFVCSDLTRLRRDQLEACLKALSSIVGQLAQLGMGRDEVIRQIELLYERMDRHD